MSRQRTFLAALVSIVVATAAPAAAEELAAEGQVPGSSVVVREIKRDAAGTVTLRFQLINDGEKKIKTYGILGEYFGMDNLSLVDTANKKKYLVVKDTEGLCVCSELKADFVPGSRFNLWAKFPAPPDTVQQITVVIPGFEPVESVPIVTAP